MPVTTKAQRSAESGESRNYVKLRICEFLSKTANLPKSSDDLKGVLFLPAEPSPGQRRQKLISAAFSLGSWLRVCERLTLAIDLSQGQRARSGDACYKIAPGMKTIFADTKVVMKSSILPGR